MYRSYVFEALFIIGGLCFLITIVVYAKDFFIRAPRDFIKDKLDFLSICFSIILLPLVMLGERYKWKSTQSLKNLKAKHGANEEDRAYPSTRNLKIDFASGEKYVYVISSTKNITDLIRDFLSALIGEHSLTDFKIAETINRKIIQFPGHIDFYDFHLFVQHLCHELGNRKCFGVYKSVKIDYHVYQDLETLNNLIGFTSTGKLFSIHILDALDEKEYLRLNQRLPVEIDWIKEALK